MNNELNNTLSILNSLLNNLINGFDVSINISVRQKEPSSQKQPLEFNSSLEDKIKLEIQPVVDKIDNTLRKPRSDKNRPRVIDHNDLDQILMAIKYILDDDSNVYGHVQSTTTAIKCLEVGVNIPDIGYIRVDPGTLKKSTINYYLSKLDNKSQSKVELKPKANKTKKSNSHQGREKDPEIHRIAKIIKIIKDDNLNFYGYRGVKKIIKLLETKGANVQNYGFVKIEPGKARLSTMTLLVGRLNKQPIEIREDGTKVYAPKLEEPKQTMKVKYHREKAIPVIDEYNTDEDNLQSNTIKESSKPITPINTEQRYPVKPKKEKSKDGCNTSILSAFTSAIDRLKEKQEEELRKRNTQKTSSITINNNRSPCEICENKSKPRTWCINELKCTKPRDWAVTRENKIYSGGPGGTVCHADI